MQRNDNGMAGGGDRKRNRRRTYVINPAFQWRYALILAVAVFLLTSVMSSVLYGVLHQQARMRLMHPETYTAEVTTVILTFGIAFSSVTAAAIGAWCLIVTHRVCGPLFVLERYLGELAEGRMPNPRSLRRKDEFKGLYATFQRAVESLKKAKQAEVEVMSEALATARAAIDSDDQTRRDALESVVSRIEPLFNNSRKTCGEDTEDSAAKPSAKKQGERTPVAVG